MRPVHATRTPRSRWRPWCRRRARAWPAQHGVSLLSLSMSVAEGFAAVGKAWDVVEEQAAKARPAGARPRHVARARHHAHRRDARAGASRTAPTACRTSPTTSAAAPASCRWPTRSTASPRRRAEFVEALRRGRRRRDRHARRRHRVHRGPARAVGRLRHVPHARPRLGRPRARRCTPTGSSPARSSRTSRASWRAPRASHDWATAKRGELFGRAGQAIMNAITDPRARRRTPKPTEDAGATH